MADKTDLVIPHLYPLDSLRRATFEDPGDTPASEWIKVWDFQEEMDAGIIGLPVWRPASRHTPIHPGPDALRSVFYAFTTYSLDHDVDIAGLRLRDLGNVEVSVLDPQKTRANIEAALAAVMEYRPDFLPIMIGGDHSVTYPAVKAFAASRVAGGRLGLIHFDAHQDIEEYDVAGKKIPCPIRNIVESKLGVDPRNVVQIGLADFQNSKGYVNWACERGISMITARQVYARGMDQVIRQAVETASEGTDAIYVTLDFDCLDQVYVPGTGVSVPGGLTPHQVIDAMYALGRRPEVKALDLACLDPTRDISNSTARLGAYLILTFLVGYYQRIHNLS